MADRMTIELTEESKTIIKKLAQAGKIDLRPSLEVIGIGYRKEVEAIFNKQQARTEGERWAPLSDNPEGKGYATWKAKKYPGQPLLVRTGLLKNSMIKKGVDGNITIINKASAVFGSNVPYGIYHNDGTSRLPKRNFSEPSEKRFEIWIGQIERDIRRHFEQNGIKVEGAIIQ